MLDAALGLLEQTVTSPWVYVVVLVVAALDGFLPAVPSESVVVVAGVFAAGGEPALGPLVLAAAAGAFVGDHVSYGLGRRGGPPLLRRLPAGGGRRAAVDRAARLLRERGGMLLVVARYVPFGRTATTLTAGATGYPLRRFSAFDAVAALSWGTYSALVGYVGGAAFEQDPLRGTLLGLGLAFGVTALTEVARWALRRRSRADRPDEDARELSPAGARGTPDR